jgi:hypothetical protein
MDPLAIAGVVIVLIVLIVAAYFLMKPEKK